MQEYRITVVRGDFDWGALPKAPIQHYPWGTAYTLPAYAQLALRENLCLLLHAECREADPRAVFHHYNDPVYTDSCLEFFAAFDADDDRYINMEMNANGALLCCIGQGRENRIPLTAVSDGQLPQVRATRAAAFWAVDAEIPLSLLSRVYGISQDAFREGYTFRGNFYKCGDRTDCPHYGCWNPVQTETPDFHRPAYFGRLRIGGKA